MFSQKNYIEPTKIITLEQAKNQLNIVDFNDDDTYIEELIVAASALCETHSKEIYQQISVLARLDVNEYCGVLPYRPFVEVTSVTNGGNELTNYRFNDLSGQITIQDPLWNKNETTDIIYTAGYEASKIPQRIIHACKIIVSDLYEHRESAVDMKMNEVKFSALRILGL